MCATSALTAPESVNESLRKGFKLTPGRKKRGEMRKKQLLCKCISLTNWGVTFSSGCSAAQNLWLDPVAPTPAHLNLVPCDRNCPEPFILLPNQAINSPQVLHGAPQPLPCAGPSHTRTPIFSPIISSTSSARCLELPLTRQQNENLGKLAF